MKEKAPNPGNEMEEGAQTGQPNLTNSLDDSIGLSSQKLRGSEERELTFS